MGKNIYLTDIHFHYFITVFCEIQLSSHDCYFYKFGVGGFMLTCKFLFIFKFQLVHKTLTNYGTNLHFYGIYHAIHDISYTIKLQPKNISKQI